ncbi:g5482 [Coccomyxa elongata]
MAEKPKDHRPTHGWSQVEELRKMEEAVKKIPDPYTVPEGYVPPTMKELWQYAQRRHPYSRYGYALVFVVGLGAYAAIAVNKVGTAHKESVKERSA